MSIKYLDMFSGIGGFRSGLEAVGGFECIGYCEIDQYARRAYEAMYDTKGEMYFENATKINPDDLPDIDLICGGFPCQAFSIAGRRNGFNDTRGTLFFEIARIAAVKKPALLFLENVPGLLNHDKGRTFATILNALDEIGYDVSWTVLNSANFGVPQARKRVYITGFLRGKCAGEVFTYPNTNPKTIVRRVPGSEGNRVYSADGLSVTLTAGGGGGGGKTGLYLIPIPVKSKTKSGYQFAFHWIGTNNKLFLFEAPIDMLSYICMNKENWKENSYAASCSISDRVLFQCLNDYPNINEVFIGYDNDFYGQRAAKRTQNKLDNMNGYKSEIIVPSYKDWNEDYLNADEEGSEINWVI